MGDRCTGHCCKRFPIPFDLLFFTIFLASVALVIVVAALALSVVMVVALARWVLA